MAKAKFFCSACGNETVGWMLQCPFCQALDTLVEEVKITGQSSKNKSTAKTPSAWLNSVEASPEEKLFALENVEKHAYVRFSSGLKELDLVLGGGFIKGSLVLIGGAPGMGKSTLLLQVAKTLAGQIPVLYICGEESPEQIKLRASRLGVQGKGIKLFTETHFESIAEILLKHKPQFVIVDSIQTLYTEQVASAPGTLSQVREVSFGFLRIAKQLGITICLVGHVTKDGQIAGPRVLEHMVDTVLYFDGEDNAGLRIIRGVKNRFGTTDEIGMFHMTEKGLEAIDNPSEELLKGRPQNTAGTAITCGMEGSRPLLIEIQALLSDAHFASPVRMVQGLDKTRLSMLLAVLEKHLNLPLSGKDAYVNVVGGVKLTDPTSDLALLAALISSYKNLAIPPSTVLMGEIGLTGEIRPIRSVEKRVTEALSLGFHRILLPGSNREVLKKLKKHQADLIFVDSLRELLDIIFMTET